MIFTWSSYAVPPFVKLWPSKWAAINNLFLFVIFILFGIKLTKKKGEYLNFESLVIYVSFIYFFIVIFILLFLLFWDNDIKWEFNF